MKKIFAICIALIFAAAQAIACEVCKKNQPEILQEVTHGPGPQGQWDYLITWAAVVIVAFTLFFSIKFLVRPKEGDPNHVKNIVLKSNESHL